MKTLVSTILLLSVFVHIQAQASSWQWSYGASGNVQASGYNIKTDPSGNVYVLGQFYSALIGIGTDTILNADTAGPISNFFLIKYSPSGSATWSKAIGAGGYGVNNPVMATDASGNVIVGGSFSGDMLVLGSDTLFNADSLGRYSPFFLVKYTSSGNLTWAVTGDSIITLAAIATDATGNIYAAGKLTDTTAIWGHDTLVNAGYYNAVVGKYDSSGNAKWARRFGGTQYDMAQSINVDAAGNSYILGVYTSPVITSGSVTISNSSGSNYLFVAKYDTAGNIAWAHGIIGEAANTNPGPANAITNDANGNVYFTGTIPGAGTLSFGDTTLNNPDITGYGDVFIAKYNSAGNVIWAKSPACSNEAQGYAVTAGSNGNIYLAGSFSGHTIVFGNDTAYNPNTTENQPEALFIVALDEQGNAIWATAAGGGDEGDYAHAIATDANGDVYVTGDFSASYIVFGADTIQGTTEDESSTVFIAKYGTVVNDIATPLTTVSIITVYPNPSTGRFCFKDVTPGSLLQVYDMLGQNVYSAIVTDNNYQMNMHGNAKGIYLYHVTDKDGNAQQGKLVLE